MNLLRQAIFLFMPPLVCVVTLVAVARAAWRARPSASSQAMSASGLLVAVSSIATQSFGFLLDPIHGAVAAGLFVLIVLMLRRASAGGFGVAFAGATMTTILGFVLVWSIYWKAPPDTVVSAAFFGMLIPCALTALVLLGAMVAFVAAGRRERRPGERVRRRTYIGAALACICWYAVGALVHWGATGPAVNVTAG